MLSWNVTPDTPQIIGPWFLWKLLIDERYQGCGYGREAVKLVADIARDQGASELLTSYVAGERSPESFYRQIGFVPTGEEDEKGEKSSPFVFATDRSVLGTGRWAGPVFRNDP